MKTHFYLFMLIGVFLMSGCTSELQQILEYHNTLPTTRADIEFEEDPDDPDIDSKILFDPNDFPLRIYKEGKIDYKIKPISNKNITLIDIAGLKPVTPYLIKSFSFELINFSVYDLKRSDEGVLLSFRVFIKVNRYWTRHYYGVPEEEKTEISNEDTIIEDVYFENTYYNSANN